MRILSLANITPYPARGGIHLRILNLLSRVAQRHEVTLGCHFWDERDRESGEVLSRMGIRTVGGMVRSGSLRQHALPGIRRALRGIPPETAQYESPALHQLVQRGGYDLLHVEETILTPYARSVAPGERPLKVLTLHNVHFAQDRRIAAIEPSAGRRAMKRWNAQWMWHYEPRVAREFDRIIAVSEDDRRTLLARDAALPIAVVPNGVDTRALQPLPEHGGRPSILFVGSMAYRPCADAAIWLVREILPRLRATIPDAEVWIVGKFPPADVLALAGAGVFVMGEVPDVVPYYARASLSVVPLRAGGGTRLKILESMALGRVVVSTALGAEGLDVSDGRDIVLAESADAMADAIAGLLRDTARRQAIARTARALVERSYDWDDIAEQQLGVFEELEASSRERRAMASLPQ
ncbi:MAG: glycosyltransferase [Gemmatimonadaceae bacterium]|nr:glycosyltransferase [Gemmatimonadaceae bacterium]